MIVCASDIPYDLKMELSDIIFNGSIQARLPYLTPIRFRMIFPNIENKLISSIVEYYKWQDTDVRVNVHAMEFYAIYKELKFEV